MENLLIATKVVLPLMVYMAVGMLTRRLSVVSEENFKVINRLIFKIFMPLTLFFNIYDADIDGAITPGVFVFVFACILLQFAGAWNIFRRAVKDVADSLTLTQGIYRSNFVLLAAWWRAPCAMRAGWRWWRLSRSLWCRCLAFWL